MERSAVRMIHIKMDPELHKRLRMRAAEEYTSIQQYVLKLLQEALDKPAREEKK